MATDPGVAFAVDPGLYQASKDMFAVFDAEDRLESANAAYCAAFFCDPADRPRWRDIMRVNFANRRGALVESDDIDAWLTDALARRATQKYRGFEADLHGGRLIWVTETLGPGGRLLLYATDITSLRSDSRLLRKERDDARRASWTDPLTGVPNRRFVLERLEEWLAAQRKETVFGKHTLAVLDLDNFKRLNDFYGHFVGDAVLISFCRSMVNRCRPVDLFGRIGGEEFLLFMPNHSIEVAQTHLEDIQRQPSQRVMDTIDTTPTCTFSAGVAALTPDEDLHGTIRRADRLLYRAKAEGRACVRS